jgi:hypothetical protein
MTQLRSQDTNLKAFHDPWTSLRLRLLKNLCHRTSESNPEGHCQTCSPQSRRPRPGDITVYLCPVFDPAQPSHEFGTWWIAKEQDTVRGR